MNVRASLPAAALFFALTSLAGAQDGAAPAQQPADDAPQTPLFCTVTVAHSCSADTCTKAEKFGDLALPAKLLIHFESRVVATTSDEGFPHLSPIASLARTGEGYVLGGVDGGLGWTIHVSSSDPHMTFVVATNQSVLTGTGSCNPAK